MSSEEADLITAEHYTHHIQALAAMSCVWQIPLLLFPRPNLVYPALNWMGQDYSGNLCLPMTALVGIPIDGDVLIAADRLRSLVDAAGNRKPISGSRVAKCIRLNDDLIVGFSGLHTITNQVLGKLYDEPLWNTADESVDAAQEIHDTGRQLPMRSEQAWERLSILLASLGTFLPDAFKAEYAILVGCKIDDKVHLYACAQETGWQLRSMGVPVWATPLDKGHGSAIERILSEEGLDAVSRARKAIGYVAERSSIVGEEILVLRLSGKGKATETTAIKPSN